MNDERLEELERLGEGDNDFWRMKCGEHQNMLDEAVQEIRRLREENEKLRETKYRPEV